jgi:hypothetical protein
MKIRIYNKAEEKKKSDIKDLFMYHVFHHLWKPINNSLILKLQKSQLLSTLEFLMKIKLSKKNKFMVQLIKLAHL